MQLAKRSWCYALHLHMQLITCNMLLKCWRKCPFWSLITLLPKRKVNVNSQAKSNKHPKLGVQNHMTISWANCYIALWWYIYIYCKNAQFVSAKNPGRDIFEWRAIFWLTFFWGFPAWLCGFYGFCGFCEGLWLLLYLALPIYLSI